MLHSCNKAKAFIVMACMTIVMTTIVLSIPMIRAETFDIKATLLKHREQHTNHLDVSFHVLPLSLCIFWIVVRLLTFRVAYIHILFPATTLRSYRKMLRTSTFDDWTCLVSKNYKM